MKIITGAKLTQARKNFSKIALIVTATTILLGTITAIHNSDNIHLKKNSKNKSFLQKAFGTVPVPQVGILIYLKVT